MCRRIERASAGPQNDAAASSEWGETLWGARDSASAAIAKLQQIQTRWAEIELELIRLDEPAVTDNPETLADLDLDLLEAELQRLRPAELCDPAVAPDAD